MSDLKRVLSIEIYLRKSKPPRSPDPLLESNLASPEKESKGISNPKYNPSFAIAGVALSVNAVSSNKISFLIIFFPFNHTFISAANDDKARVITGI
jgi:hypothetical protein